MIRVMKPGRTMARSMMIILSLLSSLSVSGQSPFHLKYELGITRDYFHIQNPEENISYQNSRSVWVGLAVSRNLTKFISVETGIYSKYYGSDILSTSPDTINLIVSNDRMQLPLRLVMSRSFFGQKLTVGAVLGTALLVGSRADALVFVPSDGWQIAGQGPDGMFALVETGALLDYEIFRNLTVGLSYRAFFGTERTLDYDVSKIRSDNTVTHFGLESRGTFGAMTLAIGYKFVKKNRF